MNPLIEAFLVECRELIEAASDDLLALEAAPRDRARLDGAFRAFHTLKGAAGIVDFPAMAQVLHAAEDGLAAARGDAGPVSGRLIGDCLACLDQVSAWLDETEAAGQPPTPAAGAAQAWTRRFAAVPPPPAPSEAPPDWVGALAADHPQGGFALRYAPDAGCFFRGEDPLALIAELPGLLALRLSSPGGPTSLGEADPFACWLVIDALLEGPPDLQTGPLRLVRDQVEIHPVAAASGGLSADGLAVLQAQRALAAEAAPEGRDGRLASAARVAQALLRRAGLATAAAEVETGARAPSAEARAAALIAALDRALSPTTPAPTAPAGAAEPPRLLRVEAARIDALLRLAGELTAASHAVGHVARLARDGTDAGALAGLLRDGHARLEGLVAELRRGALALRMLPISQATRRLPRLVREISAELGKPARLMLEGETTEADKAVVEGLFEPLLHVVRNALDHGVEPAAARAAAGKPPVATLRLSVTREAEQIVIAVSDDGGGIDLDRVRATARARGLITPDAPDPAPDQLVQLIFAPGFSTAREVTALSGRGVGMDVVREAVARLGGRVSVTSRSGAGTTVRFALPATLVMARVLTVQACGQIFGLPLEAVVETLRLPPDQVKRVGVARVVTARGRTAPVIDLAERLLRVDQRAAPAARGDEDAEARLVIVAAGGGLMALEVEAFGEWLEVMLRPMEGLLAGAACVAGATLLGDGQVLIVLDVEALAR